MLSSQRASQSINHAKTKTAAIKPKLPRVAMQQMNLAAIVLSTTLTSPKTTPETIIARNIIKSQRKSKMSKGVSSASKTRTISSKTKTATLTSRMRSKTGPTPCKPTTILPM